MSDLQPPEREYNSVFLFLGAVILFTLCVGGILLFNQFMDRIVITPTPTPETLPLFIPKTLPTETVALVIPTAILPTAVIPSVTPMSIAAAPTATSRPARSCRYGPPFINALATPVPDGHRSEYMDYLCVDGYWYIGIDDWVDARTGDWGSDGVEEKGYVMYNADGSVADRRFENLQGNTIPGPTK